MNIAEFTAAIAAVSLAAGFVGSLTGLGGGVVIVPVLTILFKVDIHYAIGASLVSVIATSSGAAAAYVREGWSNIRVGMFLEIATCSGALCGAFLAAVLKVRAIAIIFGIVLLWSAWTSARMKKEDPQTEPPSDRISRFLRMGGTYPYRGGVRHYNVRNVPGGFLVMLIAGALSGLLGIGSGALKVIAMDRVMRLPFKVSTTTSNFMIGVTAAASAGVYLNRGYIDPGLSMPVMLGVLGGSLAGARLLTGARTPVLRWVFDAVILALGVEMLYSGARGTL